MAHLNNNLFKQRTALPLVPFCFCSSVGDRLATDGFGCGKPVALGAFESACEFCKTLDAFRRFCVSGIDLTGGGG